jgi:hypothetical protein
VSTKQKRRKAAVRMLERVVREILRLEASISMVAAGREAVGLRHSVRNLKRLAEDDPDNIFWDRLQKTVIKILRYLAVEGR